MNRLHAEPNLVDITFQRLKRAGWSIGDMATGSRWTVTGNNGENVIKASGDTQEEAWRLAMIQAASVGMLHGECLNGNRASMTNG